MGPCLLRPPIWPPRSLPASWTASSATRASTRRRAATARGARPVPGSSTSGASSSRSCAPRGWRTRRRTSTATSWPRCPATWTARRSSGSSRTSTRARTRPGPPSSRSSTRPTTAARIELPKGGTVLDPAELRELAGRAGHDIVTSSGDTLLGADDKAGVAEIVTAVAHLAAHPELPRPTLRVGFTPDEEVGLGASLFDLERLRRRAARTRWTARASASCRTRRSPPPRRRSRIEGVDVHPGFATGKLVHAGRLAAAHPHGAALRIASPRRRHRGARASSTPTSSPATAARAEIRAILRDFDDDAAAGARRAAAADVAEEIMATEPRARIDVRRPRRSTPTCARYLDAVPEVVTKAERGDPRRGHRAGAQPDPRRHRRLAAQRDGPADAEHLRRAATSSTRCASGCRVQDMASAAAVVVHLARTWTETA